MDSTTPVTPALLPAQGRQRDGKRQSDPPPYRPRPGRTAGGNGAPPPPPPSPPPSTRTPWTRPAARSPHRDRAGPPHPHARAHNADSDSPPGGRAVGGGGAQDPRRPTQRSKAPPRGRPAAAPTTPSQVGGNGDRTAPPQARQTEQGTGAGHAEGHGPRGTALPAPSAGTTRDARATPPSGGGERTPRERERTHRKRDTRGLLEGQPDRARGTHRPHGMAYQRARVRDTRTRRPATRSAEHAGRGGGNERDTTPGAGPNPPEPAASAAHTQTGHCAPPRQ